MELKLVETALALVVLYLVLSLVATQLSELWAGAFESRQRNLTLMVGEAFDGNAALRDAFFAYGPIRALAKNHAKPPWLRRLAGGVYPSAIPPDLFASAFVAVLNKNVPPRSAFQTPAEFVATLDVQTPTQQVLAAHLAGSEADWNLFEARIARWFADIGDRADGWYKRRNALWMMFASALLAALANADSAYLAKRLFEDDTWRVGLANLGESIAAERARAEGGKVADRGAPPPAVADEFERAGQAVAELSAARAGIGAAIAADPKVAGFGLDLRDMKKHCTVTDAARRTESWFASNSDAWKVLVPSIQLLLDEARSGVDLQDPKSSLEPEARSKRLRQVLGCLSAISVWVRAAQADAGSERGKGGLKDAGDALERAHRAVFALLGKASIDTSLRRRFVADASGFIACADDAGGSRGRFEQCMADATRPRIPLGWPASAEQFCEPSVVQAQGAAPSSANNGWFEIFGCRDFAGSQALGLPAIDMRLDSGKLMASVLGIAVTAILVSLGAPFWFGALGKLANLRTAGRVRGIDEPDKAAAPASGTGPSTPGSPAGSASTEGAPFEDARNEFERGLRPQDITRLQKALDVPATARLDRITRNAIVARLRALDLPGDEALGSVSYEAIVGRSAASVAAPSAATGSWSRGQHAPQAIGELVQALNRIFPAPDWPSLPAAGANFDDALRARAVLYRLRAEDRPLNDSLVAELARKADGELTRLDDALRNAILAETRVFARSTPPWLDDALGELGITEIGTPAQSDPRVIEYLASLGVAPIAGDDTPWCGAFAGWVMQRAGKLGAPNFADPPSALLRAARWRDFGQAVAAGGEMPGDLCVIPTETSHHVAFWIAQDATRVWLLGGNQGKGGSGAVTLVAFRRPETPLAIRRPV